MLRENEQDGDNIVAKDDTGKFYTGDTHKMN